MRPRSSECDNFLAEVRLRTDWQVWDVWRAAGSTVLSRTPAEANCDTRMLCCTAILLSTNTHTLFCDAVCMCPHLGQKNHTVVSTEGELPPVMGLGWQTGTVWMTERWVTAQHVSLSVNNVFHLFKRRRDKHGCGTSWTCIWAHFHQSSLLYITRIQHFWDSTGHKRMANTGALQNSTARHKNKNTHLD